MPFAKAWDKESKWTSYTDDYGHARWGWFMKGSHRLVGRSGPRSSDKGKLANRLAVISNRNIGSFGYLEWVVEGR
jgi:hypothetical protein